MTRIELKKMIDQIKRPLYPASAETDPWIRRMGIISERADERYRKDLVLLYADRTVTDDERWNRWRKASTRRLAAMKKTEAVYEKYLREVEIPRRVKNGSLRPEALAYAKSRAVRA